MPEWPGLPNLTQAPQRGHEELNRRGTFTGTSKFTRFVRMENTEADRYVLTVFWGSEFTDTFLDIEFGPHPKIHVRASSSLARRRAFGNTSISIGTELTSERFSRARSLRT